MKNLESTVELVFALQVHFYLNAEILAKIERHKAKQNKLTLSDANLADLQYYALLNSPLGSTYLNHTKQKYLSSSLSGSQLTFSTNYSYSTNQQPETLFRSVINFQGVITQQIKQDLWQNQQLFDRIYQIHYWLITEILAQLPLKNKNQKPWLIQGITVLIAILIAAVLWHFLLLNMFSTGLIFICSFLIFNVIFEKLIINSLKKLIIYHFDSWQIVLKRYITEIYA